MKITKANNSKLLLEIIDICNESIRNLHTLGLENNSLTDLIIINFLTSKLDDTVIQRWELTLDNDSCPSLNTFKSFIEKEARSTQETKVSKPEFKKIQTKSVINNSVKKSNVYNTVVKKESVNNEVKNNNCILCQNVHPLYKCPKFNSMNVNDRWKVVNENHLCINCLRNNHEIDTCRIGFGCKVCFARHHSLIHVYTVNNQEHQSQSVSTVANSYTNSRKQSNTLLSTAIIKVKSKSGNQITCRALIDNGSQHSLISKHCAERLHLTMQQSKHHLVGINEICAETCLYSTNFEFSPYFSLETFQVTALVVNKVTTSLPNFSMQKQNWTHLSNLCLADPSYFIESEIDILLGADIFLPLITGSPILGPKGTPSALPTKLGHLLSGSVNAPVNQNSSVSQNSYVICHTLVNIENNLKNFWELEAIQKPEKPNQSLNDPSEIIYSRTTTRNEEGRYVVKLPLKENYSLGDSANHAFHAFKSLEKRFESNPHLKQSYSEFMSEYSQLGHMTLLNIEDLNTNPNYYVPHHAVTNENSTTTKLRVVFNASAKTSNGQSLNLNLHKGHKLQTSIFSHLIKFRLNKIALSSDIEKMYRQILISKEDTQLQRIFWRANTSDPLCVYTLNTVTYGTSCAPFLALRTIQQLLSDERNNFPSAVKAARDHMYVDDFLGGTNSIKSAQNLVTELQNLFNSGGFKLRKWASNCPEALDKLPDSLKAKTTSHSFNPDSSQRILGLEWNLDADTLRVQVSEEKMVESKRQLLSIIARIFDPLGFLSPSTVILKILLQDVWKANLSWDDPLPLTMLSTWQQFYSEIDSFKTMSINRFINITNPESAELHGFCDASTKAYAAVIYLKLLNDPIEIKIVAAKTRIAPLTPMTLPRLELSSALLLAELVSVVTETLSIKIQKTFLWTDSTIALSWILNPPLKNNQYALHRATKIRDLTLPTTWHHIPGKLNPADCATRGLYPHQLKSCDTWWSGPEWLYISSNPSSSLTMLIADKSSKDPINEIPSVDNQTVSNWDLLTRFSSYTKLLRVIAWIKRFLNNAQYSTKVKGPLNAVELSNACKIIVKLIQNSEFAREICMIQNSKSLPKSSKLLSLNAFLDSESILRVGGRLSKNQTLSFDAKHQMLLPKHHPVTSAIIRYFHMYSMHGGPELVLSLIRQKFWIPDGRSTVKKELRQCLSCRKVNAQPITQIMGDLPASRITPSRPFQRVGTDYAGPINTKCQHKRKSSTFKSYICLFVCLCTKAVHIELVSELTTEAFLQTLKRFIARRGCPSDIYSDNGRNFVGASSYIKTLNKLAQEVKIQNYTSQLHISWHFIPPYGPNFGGLWESSIKLAKRHMIKISRGNLMTFEELATLLCMIEACINSRPLTPISTEPTDMQALTPGHFLIGSSLLQLPEISNTHNTNPSLSLSSRWSSLQNLQKAFWNRWQKEYLNSLTYRRKWRTGAASLKVGDLVLVKDPTSLPGQWNLARIYETHPGADGVIRVVTLKTNQGIVKRLVHQIALLSDEALPRPPPGVCRIMLNSESCQ